MIIFDEIQECSNALNLLNDANIALKVYRIKNPSFPIVAYTYLSAFKIYVADV